MARQNNEPEHEVHPGDDIEHILACSTTASDQLGRLTDESIDQTELAAAFARTVEAVWRNHTGPASRIGEIAAEAHAELERHANALEAIVDRLSAFVADEAAHEDLDNNEVEARLEPLLEEMNQAENEAADAAERPLS